MSALRDQPFSLSPEAARKEAEVTFGERIESLVHRAGARVVDVERALGLGDAKIYRHFRGVENFRAAWIALLPPAVELLYLEERAQHHGRELAPIGDASSPSARLHAVVAELADVMRVASVSESDGNVSVEDAMAEREEIAEARKALADRDAHLVAVIAARGMRVVQGGGR